MLAVVVRTNSPTGPLTSGAFNQDNKRRHAESSQLPFVLSPISCSHIALLLAPPGYKLPQRVVDRAKVRVASLLSVAELSSLLSFLRK